MDKTILEIPTELLQAARITPEQAKTELAIRLYQLHKLNDKQAAELAGNPQAIQNQVWNIEQTGRFNLDDFLDWASHDLKTPLNAVIGFTKVVIKGIDGPINETQNTDLNTAFNSGQRMLALLSQLVEIARINKGHYTPLREETDLTTLLGEFVTRWKNQNPTIPLNTDIRIASPTFNVDPAQMRQIVSHSLTFATVRVKGGTLTLSVNEDEAGLNLAVQSTGEKAPDKAEMDSAMLSFILNSLIKINGGVLQESQETDDGFLLRFTLPREIKPD